MPPNPDFTSLRESVVTELVSDVEQDLAARGLNPFGWQSVVATASLVVSGADPDVFYMDIESRDRSLPRPVFDDLVELGSALDSSAVAVLIRVANTLDATGVYGVDLELGFRSETGVLEYVVAPPLDS